MKDLKAAAGEAFPLCYDCAALYTAAFPLKKLGVGDGDSWPPRGGVERRAVCSNCRKKKLCCEYVVER